MALNKRVHTLEEAAAKPVGLSCTIQREILQPSASGPELVALAICGGGSDSMRLDREPDEDEAAFRARFDKACAS